MKKLHSALILDPTMYDSNALFFSINIHLRIKKEDISTETVAVVGHILYFIT